MYKLLLLFGFFVSGVKCGYYFVTAPNIIRFNHSETIVVSVFGLNNAFVKVWLQHGDKRFSEIDAYVMNENSPRHAVIKVTEDDLFDTVVKEKPRQIKICSEWQGQIRTRDVILSYQTGYIIVQTDKPIYTPLQEVKIRALALDESLKAVDGWQLGMDIVSPSNLTMGRRRMLNSKSGFFTHWFTLPPYPALGIWTARAFYGGQYETESRSLFEVKEYVLPSFGVTIDVDVPFILMDTDDILVTVRAKYVYDKPVTGNARVTLNLKDEYGLSKYILDVQKKWLDTGNQDSRVSVAEFSIPVNSILNSPLLENREFPVGNRLEVVAIVLESATGKEEATSHEGTIFANQPYIFRFTRSKLYFNPGMMYFIKVEMLFANGQPAKGQRLKVKMFENDEFQEFKSEVTDSTGLAVCIFSTSNSAASIMFKAATDDERQESEPFQVTAYAGQNQMQVERIISNDDSMLMQAFTNIQGNSYTGMLFMVVTRGHIVFTQFKEAANLAIVDITEDLQEKITPSARLLVFYVDRNTHELVADSIKFDVEKKCRGHGLNLETRTGELKPGFSNELTISGSPFMWVGLNIIDKALLQQKSNTVLRKKKKSGLTMLTNAEVDEDRIVRYKENCDGMKRKKRDIYDSNSLGYESEYATDLARLTDMDIKHRKTRSYLHGSLLFVVDQLNKHGEIKIRLSFPESVTNWEIQALGITPDKGMCIADAIDVKTYKDFFIELDLPYKAVRLEQFDVKATIFSFGDENIQANVYLYGAEYLCYNKVAGEESPKITIDLPPNSTKTVSFPMIPLRSGKFSVKVSARKTAVFPQFDEIEKKLYVVNEGVEEQIAINVCLDPMNQAKDCRNDDRVISDVFGDGERVFKIDLTLPINSIPQTGAATAYIQTSTMTKIVNALIGGVDTLFDKPTGSGEQTMIRLAPTVYAMGYLKETGQVTAKIEITGNQYIRDGSKWLSQW